MANEESGSFKLTIPRIHPTSEAAYEEDLRIISQKTAKLDFILYFGRDDFSDNSKYLYLHASANPCDHRHIWCSFNKKLVRELRSQGLEAFDLGEDANKTIQILLRTKVAVHSLNPSESLQSRIFLAASAGALKVQLWHGIGIKRMEMQNIEHKDFLNLASVGKMRWSTEIDCIVSPSAPFDWHWQETFGVERVIRAGYPRNEVLLRPASERELINVPEELIRDSARRKVLIAPTWGTNIDRHWSKSMGCIRDMARKHDLEVYLKPHPYEAIPGEELPSLGDDRVTVLPAGMDIYPLLNRFSCMITDHSSMAFDLLLLNMPLIFLEPNDTRFYMTEMLEPKLGPSIPDLNGLKDFSTLMEESLQCHENRAQAAKKYFETSPLEANQTIHDTIISLARG